MREVIVYLLIAVSSLAVTAYAIHMLVGGLVRLETEYFLITVACALIAGVMGYMVRDVIQHRSGKK